MQQPTVPFVKAWLTRRNINFCFAIVLQLSAQQNFTQQKILS
jgi:hypothetical protein